MKVITLNEYLVRHYRNTDSDIGAKYFEIHVYGGAFNGFLKTGDEFSGKYMERQRRCGPLDTSRSCRISCGRLVNLR